jgi:DNA-directed RNA polymerase specialized sigma24 family protein
MIVRNTVLKHLRSVGRAGRSEIAIEDLGDQPETAHASPISGAIEAESRAECVRVYMAYLHLYMRFYSMLSERERTALRLVEVDELTLPPGGPGSRHQAREPEDGHLPSPSQDPPRHA